jgi:bifunctional DNA-binding transcriptional regulator/antitoxin component of YhaV-PrlF toxin-antitoxin module
MKKETMYVKVDSRNRVTIPRQIFQRKGGLPHLYKVYEKDGQISLEPIKEIPKEKQWLFDPKNKAVVDELKRALKQKADRDIDLDAL